MTIGQTIAKLRKERGMTQEQLARQLYVSRQAVSKWETGSAQPDLDNIRALSEFFGVSSDLFLHPELEIQESVSAQEIFDGIEPSAEEKMEDPAEIKTNTGLWKVVLLCLCFVLLLGCCAAAPFVLRRFDLALAYDWLLPLGATGLTVLGAGAVYLVSRRTKKGLAAVLFLVAIGLALSIWLWYGRYQERIQFDSYLVTSPEKKEAFLLRQDVETGQTSYFRRRFWVLMQQREGIPNRIQGKPKFQWMTEDVCAITYEGKDDGAMHQFVATFGDRDPGSYYYVLSALYGIWSGKEAGTEDWNITADNNGITLTVGDQPEESYTFEECVQFGTTAIVLCRGGLPRWTIALNTDCTLSPGSNLIAPGGTITLTQVSMSDTPNYVFVCDTDGQKQEDLNNSTILPPSQEQIDQETVSSMQRLASEPNLSQEEIPEGTQLLTEGIGNFPWMIFLSLIETDDTVMGANGVDVWLHLESVRLISGDESDGCWEVQMRQAYVSPGNQGASPTVESAESSHYMRLIQTANGAYLSYRSNYDLSFGLEEAQSDEIDLSQLDAYHRFEPADYSGENWKYMNVSRLSPQEAAEWLYETQFAEDYPNAVFLSDNARAGYRLEDGCYLLYDGIWQENGNWVYRFWCYRSAEENVAQWDGQVETLGYFDVDFHAYEK